MKQNIIQFSLFDERRGLLLEREVIEGKSARDALQKHIGSSNFMPFESFLNKMTRECGTYSYFACFLTPFKEEDGLMVKKGRIRKFAVFTKVGD